MGGPAYEPESVLGLPSGEIAIMGPEAAINAVYANQLADIDDEDARAEREQELREEYRRDIDVHRMASEVVIDEIVPPSELREELVARFDFYADIEKSVPSGSASAILNASTRIVTIPRSPSLVSRLSVTVERARIVSPWKTGFGCDTSSYERFAMIVPSVVSGMETPTATLIVNRPLTSRSPNWVSAAKSALRWSGCWFIVVSQNTWLSRSLIVRRRSWSIVSPTVNAS
jgi:hypothetical protein